MENISARTQTTVTANANDQCNNLNLLSMFSELSKEQLSELASMVNDRFFDGKWKNRSNELSENPVVIPKVSIADKRKQAEADYQIWQKKHIGGFRFPSRRWDIGLSELDAPIRYTAYPYGLNQNTFDVLTDMYIYGFIRGMHCAKSQEKKAKKAAESANFQRLR